MQVANVLHRAPRPDLTVVLTGGVRTPSDALVGPIAVTAIRSLHVDVLFMGVHGMTADAGFTTPEPARSRDQPRARRGVGADRRRRRPHEVGHPRPEPHRATWMRPTSSSPTPAWMPARAPAIGEHVERVLIAADSARSPREPTAREHPDAAATCATDRADAARTRYRRRLAPGPPEPAATRLPVLPRRARGAGELRRALVPEPLARDAGRAAARSCSTRRSTTRRSGRSARGRAQGRRPVGRAHGGARGPRRRRVRARVREPRRRGRRDDHAPARPDLRVRVRAGAAAPRARSAARARRARRPARRRGAGLARLGAGGADLPVRAACSRRTSPSRTCRRSTAPAATGSPRCSSTCSSASTACSRPQTPYMLWIHQRPFDGGDWPGARLHVEIVTPWRAPGVPRYVAAGELGSGVTSTRSRPRPPRRRCATRSERAREQPRVAALRRRPARAGRCRSSQSLNRLAAERDARAAAPPASATLDGAGEFRLARAAGGRAARARDRARLARGRRAGPLDDAGLRQPHYTNVVMPFDDPPPHVPEQNPTGIYRRTFTIPRGWRSRPVVAPLRRRRGRALRAW